MKKQFMKYTDGINVREKKVRRGYLNQDEQNLIIMLSATHQLMMGIRSLHEKGDGVPMWERFEKSGMITKEQIKCLKMATTYQRKFLTSFIEDNLDRKAKETIAKKMMKWELRVADDYQIKKLERMVNKLGDVQLTIEELFSLVDGKLYAECKGCTKDRSDCKLRDFLENHLIPPVCDMVEVGKEGCNCEYAM